MQTKEEMNTPKKEVGALGGKPTELSDDDLMQVSDGFSSNDELDDDDFLALINASSGKVKAAPATFGENGKMMRRRK